MTLLRQPLVSEMIIAVVMQVVILSLSPAMRIVFVQVVIDLEEDVVFQRSLAQGLH